MNKWSFSLKAFSSSTSEPSAIRIVLPLFPYFFSALTKYNQIQCPALMLTYLYIGVSKNMLVSS